MLSTNLLFFSFSHIKYHINPTTKIGQEAELKSSQLFWRNAGRIAQPQTAEGRKLYQEQLNLSRSSSPQFFREADILRQLKNESKFIAPIFIHIT